MWQAIFLVSFVVLFSGGIFLAERARLRRLLNRPCAGIRWHRQFPAVSHDEIRAFLRLFTEAFAIDPVHSTKFAPDDRPRAIYEARYIPHLTLDDHMEWESLTKAFRTTYGIDLESVFQPDTTLAELFSLTRSNGGARSTA